MQKFFFISCFVFVAFAGFSQTPTFTFECFCGTLTAADTTCDICNTSTQSRYFKGLLIRKNGVAFRWIEEPYTVIQNFNALTFRELIPNAEQIRIELSGTQWTTIEGFRDSVQCPCAGGGSVTLVPGPGVNIYGDTIAVIPQQIDTFDIVGGDTLRLSLTRDSVPFHFVILPSGVDTSGYNYSFEIDGDSLCVTDGAGTFCVDVSQFLDNTDTSGYNLAMYISSDTLYLTDGDGTLSAVLPTPDGSETIVTGANGVQVTGTGTSGTPYVVAPPSGTDTQTLRYSGTTLTANSALTNNGSQVGVNTSPDASYRLKVKQSTDTDGVAVERSSSTSQIRLYHNANGILETNANNMHLRSSGNVEIYGAGSGFVTQVSVKTINPITVASGNSGALRIDPTYSPTASGGDFGFLKIFPTVNQTSASDQALYGIDFNPTLTSLQGQLYGFRYQPSVGRFLYQPSGDTVSSHFRGRLGIGSGTTDPVRRLHVVGDMRLTGSIDTPTAVMGRDGDGDVANLGLSGISIISGTLTADDVSPTNEIQRLDTFEIVSNMLRASLLNDAVPFSLVDLSPYVNVGTDLSYTGSSSPVTLNSSTGNDVTVTAGTGISLSATSGNLTVTNSDPDQSTTNELQTLANTSNSTTHTVALSNSGGSVQVAEGTGIGLSTTGTTLDGVVTVTNTAPDQTVTITNGGGITVGGSYPSFTLTAADQSATNEIQTISATGAGPTSYDIELNLSGGAVTLTEGAGINLTRSTNTITVASTITDTDAQNLTIEGSGPTYEIAISGGTDVTIAGGGILTLSESPANTLILTATEVDGAPNNEGILGVGAGGANTATLLSNTVGQLAVTVSGSTGIGISESTSGNGGTITVSPANDLAALEALGSTGIAVRTASETWAQRTITAGTGISVSDGNGVSGNPTITNTGDLSATNEAWTIDADDADTELITTQTVKFQGGGITVTDYAPGTDILTITSTEVDGSVTNEGSLTVGAGGANSSTIVSNTSGSTAVTVAGAGIVTVTESGSTITITGTEVDGSTSNELQTYGHAGTTSYTNTLSSGGGSFTLQSGGIVSLSHTAGTTTISATEVDGSTTNELQTLNSTGDATSHTATLSNSGGSLKLKEGTNVTLTTDVTGLNGEVTISATSSTDGNGIYGDGTAGSGSDILPPGGSEVTIPGIYQPLNFLVDASPGNVYTALQVTTDYTGDDVFTHYLIGKTPVDSFSISAFDSGTRLWGQSGPLDIKGDEDVYINSAEKIIISADSVQATANTATTMPWITGEGVSGYMKRIQGASSGQILKWNGTNWALASDDTGGGGLTGAENGLSVSGSNVRLGGTLLVNTSIAQAGFGLLHNNGKWSHSTSTLFGFTPTQGFGIMGTEGNPSTAGSPTLDGIIELKAHASNAEQGNSLTIGAYTTDNQGMWLQARSDFVPTFHYPIQLNPRGGPVSIGRGTTIPTSRFTVTATGATGSTASGMVALLENTGGSGNVSLGLGAGSDAVSGQLMWNGTADAMRITNRNSTNGTSSVRVAIGGETSDVATFEKSSATSLVQFGVGTTTPHSTIQSAGSIAAAYLETVGAPTFDETKHTVIYTASTNITWTLPTAAACACQGRVYVLHHSGTAGTLTLSQTITKGAGGNFNALTAGQWAYIVYGSSTIRGYKLASL